MIKSMTGFGKTNFENDLIKIEVEIKSLNSKGFDLKIKFPNILAEQEMKIRNLLSKSLFRGKIDCSIKIEYKQNQGNYQINEEIFDKYYKQFTGITKKYGKFPEEVNVFEILMKFPEVIENQEYENTEMWELIYETIQNASQKLVDFRTQEGEATQKGLLINIAKIDDNLTIIPQFEQERIEKMRLKLKKALDDNKLDINNDRFESELVYYLEKFDINEEKIRLANHLKYFKETLRENESGKKLNFITQEMGREINTLGSKANHFEIQKLVVGMKDELEKIKEQILNIV